VPSWRIRRHGAISFRQCEPTFTWAEGHSWSATKPPPPFRIDPARELPTGGRLLRLEQLIPPCPDGGAAEQYPERTIRTPCESHLAPLLIDAA